jgi:hypothetical protein
MIRAEMPVAVPNRGTGGPKAVARNRRECRLPDESAPADRPKTWNSLAMSGPNPSRKVSRFGSLGNRRVTAVASVLAAAFVATAWFTPVDLKLDPHVLNGVNKNGIVDVLMGFGLVLIGLVVDRMVSGRRNRHLAEIEAERLRTFKTTMRSVQDVMNDFLDNILRFEMEQKTALPSGTLNQLEDLTQQAFQKLRALGEAAIACDAVLATGPGIAFADPPTTASGSPTFPAATSKSFRLNF